MSSLAQFIRGEKQLVFGSITAGSGTLTISGTPTCILYDPSGVAVSGFPLNVTGSDSGAIPVARAWFNLDTTGFLLDDYVLTFTMNVTGSDGNARVVKPNVTVRVVSESTVLS